MRLYAFVKENKLDFSFVLMLKKQLPHTGKTIEDVRDKGSWFWIYLVLKCF